MEIDFVIPWVDGTDIEWLKKKNYYLHGDINIDVSDARFRDWENLKYWFRGVEKFAPWVRRIYLVTDHQVPVWINKNNSKLVLVNHEDFIPQKYLPVFSSHPIELNMHRIEGLSEHFVYFNDDIFLTGKVKKEDFFKNGLPCSYAAESPVTPDTNDIFNHILLNNCALINENYSRKKFLKEQRKKRFSLIDKKGFLMNLALSALRRDAFFGFEYSHLPSSFLKSSLEAVWKESYEWLDTTCSHRFRSIDDVNQYVFIYYQYIHGLYSPYNYRKNGKAFHIDDSISGFVDNMCADIQSGRYKEICVNESKVQDFECTKVLVNKAFDKLFPEKSEFEV